jgi:hypothetical protein
MPMTAESGIPTFGSSARTGPPAPNDRVDRPAKRDPALLRISDGDRQDFISQLTRHCAEGRLTFEELDERIERAWSARTQADLSPLAEDLPALTPAQGSAPTMQSWLADGKSLLMTVPARILIAGGAGLLLVCMVLFLLAGHGMVDTGGHP